VLEIVVAQQSLDLSDVRNDIAIKCYENRKKFKRNRYFVVGCVSV
jgi:hypothetical protein